MGGEGSITCGTRECYRYLQRFLFAVRVDGTWVGVGGKGEGDNVRNKPTSPSIHASYALLASAFFWLRANSNLRNLGFQGLGLTPSELFTCSITPLRLSHPSDCHVYPKPAW